MTNKLHTIYLDHAASTHTDTEVLQSMLPFFTEEFGNPESLHTKGQNARIALDKSREIIAKILNCQASEIVFTSGGTEANNLAILGTARANKNKGFHIITSAVEHPSILAPMKILEKEGWKITRLKVDSVGLIDPDELKSEIKPNTAMISIMYANNEIGTIEPIKEIGRICREKNIILHTDACQAAGTLDLNVNNLNVDLLTINGGKIYGPKGIGALYINKKIKIDQLIFGGSQENNLRAGTQNVPAIMGLAKAITLATENRENENSRLTKLRDSLINGILKSIPGSHLNGPNPSKIPCPRLPNNVNFSFEKVSGQDLLLQLDETGIYVGTGSACNSSTQPSHVLMAIATPDNLIQNSIRLTLGRKTTEEDIDYVLNALIKLVEKIRKRG